MNEQSVEISRIMRDLSITPQQRQQRIQEILSGRSTSSLDTTSIQHHDTATTTSIEISMPPSLPPQPPPCTHYNKKCSNFYFSCCETRDSCHRCHKEFRNCQTPKITEIICNECGTAQEPSPSCLHCSVSFSRSFCPICNIWTEKEIFHCNGCGLCRVGKKEDHFHCEACNGCFLLSSQSTHKCIYRPMNEVDCPLCMESVHSSQSSGYILPCGHVVHTPCFYHSMRSGGYRCPSCRKSMVDMRETWDEIRRSIASQPMEVPLSVEYVCFDCGNRGRGMFHFLGIECVGCNGYNTSRS
jgi:RING finger and CHY zinc finger domain-containing protein 1